MERSEYMELVMSPAQLQVMRGIKNALDPNHILNPGKIFSTPTT
jgi:glycolate oxidase